MNAPSILILSFSPIARDPRVLRQIGLLSPLYEVHTVGYGPKPEGVASHRQVPDHLLNWRSNYRRFYALSLTRQFRRLYFGAPFVRFVLDNVEAKRFDVILANDASAVPAAAALKPRRGLHADIHEYATRQGEGNRIWERFSRPLVRWIVAEHVAKADSVTTVSRGLAAEYRREFGIEAEVVPNAARYRPEYSVRPTPREEPIRLVHTGAAGRERHIEKMISAVAAANEERPGAFVFDLYLIAGDASYIEELRALVDTQGDDAISIKDPVAFDRIVPTLAEYDVGMYVCPPTNFNLRYSLPNKFFEFVQARLGLLIGPSEDMRRYADEHGFGVVSRDFSITAQVETLRDLTPVMVDELKARADAAAPLLDAEKISDPWRAAVATLVRDDEDADTGS